MSAAGLVLVSWIATSRDPFEKQNGRYREVDGKRVPGPTLAILTDPASEIAGKVTHAVILRQGGKEADRQTAIYEDLVKAIGQACPTLQLFPYVWDGEDPTDHAALFEFLRVKLPEIRRRLPGRELIIHVSPGTPSMHTVWVLMAETGFIDPPFRIVKSVEPAHRRDGRAVIPVKIGIDTFYKRYQETRPTGPRSGEETVRWDPTKFESPKLPELFKEARRVAKLKIPVLLLGERGTGKTTLAGWIRLSSPYRKGARDQGWPAVACGQFSSSETMRAELFGYEEGAFTGAKARRDGLLHAANGDTLFLDEIGDISRDVQRLLIKALEEHTFQRLGSTRVEKSDFRLVTATNLPLRELSEKLGADFFDRIRASVLRVPALREIPEDLGWLWDTTLTEAARRARVDPRYAKLSSRERSRLLEALRRHPLPANLRDLFRVAWRFLAAHSDDHAPLAPGEALDYALHALDAPHTTDGHQPRAIARSFAENAPIPVSLLESGPIQHEAFFDELRDYLAREARRLRDETGRPHEEVIDVTERGLRNWKRKDSSGSAER